MERTNVYAYTAPGSNYPEYISINRTSDGMEITVRSHAKQDGACGDTASIILSNEEYANLVRSRGDV